MAKLLWCVHNLVICTALLFASFEIHAQGRPNNVPFNQLLDEYYEEGLSFDPLAATQRGDSRFNDILLNDISAPHLLKVHDFNIKFKRRFAAYNREGLNAFDKVSFDIVNLQIKQALDKEQFHFEYIPFNQFQGLPLRMPSLGSGKDAQPFKTVKDYENWLGRINGFADWTDTAIANFNKGIATGMVLPKSLVIKMIPQMEAQSITDSSKNLFYGPLRIMPASFTEKEKKDISEAYHKAISQKIIPSYQKLAEYLKLVYLPKTRITSGCNALPNGAAMYRHLIEVFTTTNKTPEEIYNTGLKEVNRITKEIEVLKIKSGFKGSMEEFYKYSLNDKQFFPFTTDEQVLDSFRAMLPRITPYVNNLFSIVPKTAFEVRAIEKFKAASSSANYQRGTVDGSRPGYFNVPIVDSRKYSTAGMENLFLHEAIPGHHFQISLQQENSSLPKVRKHAWYPVFSEGWALYTESLGDELGLYTDPYQKLAAHKAELFRAIRLVVDVGLHTGKMTREEAIKYIMEKGGRSEQYAVSETERYMSYAGQALSYKTGELKIQELKARYQKQLGADFSIKNFHDAILLGGSMPLTVFESYMDDWAENQNFPQRNTLNKDIETIKELEYEWLAAEFKLDTATIASMMDETFIAVGLTGTTTKKEELKELYINIQERLSKGHVVDSFYLDDMRVKIYDNTAVVTFFTVTSGKIKDVPFANRRTRFYDVWIKRNGQWKAVSSQMTPIE